MLPETESKYQNWLNEPSLSSEEKEELSNIASDEKEIISRFKDDLEFGTGGLRGIMGLGTNRMNNYVVRRVTQGLAQYLQKTNKNDLSVAISYDSRHHSRSFAIEVATVLAANKIKAYLFKELMPTPALSFATRYLKCNAGVMITASHNPSEYNGYKVYGSDGAQLALEPSNEVIKEIEQVDIFKGVLYGNFDKFVLNGLIDFIDEDLIEAYFNSTLKTSLIDIQKTINIAYTPLYGAGFRSVLTVLRRAGYQVDIVNEQAKPNGDFPTCPYPNPETEKALKLGIELMLNNNDDILLATDPDSDRVGVVVNQKGKPIILTGNEVGILLFDYIYKTKKETNNLSESPLIVKTIVSSDMINVMAKEYGVEVVDVLTGFKFIGEQIRLLEEKNQESCYLLGFEESCGYLTNIDVRDKDAVNACLLVAEMANLYKNEGKTLVDHLKELYKYFGDYKTLTLSYQIDGLDGKEKISNIMEYFRSNKVDNMFSNIDHVGDYKKGYIHYKDHDEYTNLPSSNVIKLFLASGETITVRPSGTEPKIKFYILALGNKNIEKYKKIIEEYMENF